jgi:hypothetical protein
VVTAAPACKGPNKNDPGCDTTSAPEEPAAEPAVAGLIDSATVDWSNQRVRVRGSGLSGVAQFTIGGSAVLAEANESDTQLDLLFDAAMAAAVTLEGSYALKADGADVISIYFKSQVVDPAATGCPCETDWTEELGGLWGTPQTECVEILGPGSNDVADIAGTVLTDYTDPTVYPQFPVGASFTPGDPVDSSCRLVRIDGDATTTELVNIRVNESQQADCAASLKLHVCASILPGP